MEKKLKKYQQKRDFNKTNEPVGKTKKETKKLRFVIQHHLARKDHYDFRLEWKGTLKSWAVPKGPSYDPKEKRLAIMVEDHPFDYRNFEGTIPKGQYGGGTVMIFDEGFYEPLEDFNKGFQQGSLKFTLKGNRLKGNWTLVHFKEDNWLLIKEHDAYENLCDIKKYKRSIRSNRTMKEIEKGIVLRKNSKKEGIVKNIKITHPEKLIYPKEKIKKIDVVQYYQKVAPRMLPFIQNRIISTIRSPEGIEGEKFFKKHLDINHSGIGKKKLSSDKKKREDYYYIKNIEGLIFEVQQNSFEFHTWGSTIEKLEHPDILVFDLDPDEKLNLNRVRQGVKDLKSILDELSLTSFLKTSGGKGYHVVVPIHSIKSWKKFREFAKNIAKLMERKWPDRYTSNVRMENRKGKIFIDWIRNTRGATSVAPYSLRLRSSAPVSMPIKWSELDKVKPNEININTAIKRIKRNDPWEGFFEIDQ